ncbi:MAG: hypothetical protein AB4426_11330 [Xenococcaceae cyanobacterium]
MLNFCTWEKKHGCGESSTILLSLATTPFILGMLAVQSLAQTLIEVGQASEEVFRGDRLPILHIPDLEDEQ